MASNTIVSGLAETANARPSSAEAGGEDVQIGFLKEATKDLQNRGIIVDNQQDRHKTKSASEPGNDSLTAEITKSLGIW